MAVIRNSNPQVLVVESTCFFPTSRFSEQSSSCMTMEQLVTSTNLQETQVHNSLFPFPRHRTMCITRGTDGCARGDVQ